jgi:uncharacterized membrane-anchored protein YjiN (DUF445 family)
LNDDWRLAGLTIQSATFRGEGFSVMTDSLLSLDAKIVRQWGREYAELHAKRQELNQRIQFTEQHFLASLSEPLSQHLMDLMREDAQLLGQMINHLVQS